MAMAGFVLELCCKSMHGAWIKIADEKVGVAEVGL